MTLFAKCDRNTSFFHNHVNGKRKKLQVKRIQNGDGYWIEDHDQMANVMEFYKKQFTREEDPTYFTLLDNFLTMVTMEQNFELCRYPTLKEVN